MFRGSEAMEAPMEMGGDLSDSHPASSKRGGKTKPVGVKLTGIGCSEARIKAFRAHWRAICGDTSIDVPPRPTDPPRTTSTTSSTTSTTPTSAPRANTTTTSTTTQAPTSTTTNAGATFRAELAAAHSPASISVDVDTFLNIVRTLPKGKAGGDDGVLSEFFVAVHESHMCDLHRPVESRLQRGESALKSWGRATVTLIPKVSNPEAAGDYRPITVLPTIQKVILRTWMTLATPWLGLREVTSHGFRSSYQCAEAHAVARQVPARRTEWGLSTVIAKLDISKAYDTVTHDAIQECFDRRGLPIPLQAAYWRDHLHRSLLFRTSDGLTAFTVKPGRGKPPGAPE